MHTVATRRMESPDLSRAHSPASRIPNRVCRPDMNSQCAPSSLVRTCALRSPGDWNRRHGASRQSPPPATPLPTPAPQADRRRFRSAFGAWIRGLRVSRQFGRPDTAPMPRDGRITHSSRTIHHALGSTANVPRFPRSSSHQSPRHPLPRRSRFEACRVLSERSQPRPQCSLRPPFSSAQYSAPVTGPKESRAIVRLHKHGGNVNNATCYRN